MSRLSVYFLSILIVLVACMVSGLRLFLLHLDYFRPQIVEKIEHYYGVPIKIGALNIHWNISSPILELHNISFTQLVGNVTVNNITLVLDIWQSLLHWRWHFHSLNFDRVKVKSYENCSPYVLRYNQLEKDIFIHMLLYQLDNFILRDSKVVLQIPSGRNIQIDIPNFVCFKTATRRRAEGKFIFSTYEGHHGEIQVRIDLHNKRGKISTGQVYLQAHELNIHPWISRYIEGKTGVLCSDTVNFSSWIKIRDGNVQSGHIIIKNGRVHWSLEDNDHELTVDNLHLQLDRFDDRWICYIPKIKLSTDGRSWPSGLLSLVYIPKNTRLIGVGRSAELRLRATNLQLELIEPIFPTIHLLTPDMIRFWDKIHPKGSIDYIGIDIPLQHPKHSRFIAAWKDVSWKPCNLLPGINHFTGSVSGSLMHAGLSFSLKNSYLLYSKDHLLLPIGVISASGYTSFRYNDQGWCLKGDHLNVKSDALWATGTFRYQKPKHGHPWLSILSGIRLYNAAQALRYFPKLSVGKTLADYLTGSLKGGRVDNATLLYSGNPHDFPYTHNEGQFQIFVPLRDASFKFHHDWMPLSNLNIDLFFLNDGLSAYISNMQLGTIIGTDITAVIPYYHNKRLFINANLFGSYHAIYEYFKKSPLSHSIGSILDKMQFDGNISGCLHLDIPLTGKGTKASGNFAFKNNSLLIKALNSKLTRLNGLLYFNNSNLTSNIINAYWLDQPVSLTISNIASKDNNSINVQLKGDWHIPKLSCLRGSLAKYISGHAVWNTSIAIKLPYKRDLSYDIALNADLKKIHSRLPAPFDNKLHKDPWPLILNGKGDLHSVYISGKLGISHHFNSQFILQKHIVKLARASFSDKKIKDLKLPQGEAVTLTFSTLNIAKWITILEFMQNNDSSQYLGYYFIYPKKFNLNVQQLILAGQTWHNVVILASKLNTGIHINAKGSEINGVAFLDNNNTLNANLVYLYYHQYYITKSLVKNKVSCIPSTLHLIPFYQWPKKIILSCNDCWVMGQHLHYVAADLYPKRDKLILNNGLINTGNTQLIFSGIWNYIGANHHTFLKGHLKGANITSSSNYFGFNVLPKNSPFNINFDLNWIGVPWCLQIDSLSGTLNSTLGKGSIDHAGGGRTGQILRLISVDALLRKLKLDFRDTFSQGFYYDSINSNGNFNHGILVTNDLLIDGLSADVAMKGLVNFVTRRIDMRAVIAPDLSGTLGVATALIINPMVGAVVFAASKVLAPLWNKISLICYTITGSLYHPDIKEVLRQTKTTE